MKVSIKPKQSLGQNFLIDENIVRNIVRDIALSGDQIVLEIGPGLGALSRHLGDKINHLILVEVDRRAVAELEQQFAGHSNITILHNDILDVSLADIAKKFHNRLRIVGNIPYHLTSAILFKVFDERSCILDLTMMIQREVAERLAAKPGSKDYGILAVMSGFYGTVRNLFHVSPNCFYPKPKVSSTVVQLRLHDPLPYAVDPGIFRTLVKTAFGKRRKTLRNTFRYLPFDEEIINSFIAESGAILDRRAEQLSVEEFARLSEKLQKNLPQ